MAEQTLRNWLRLNNEGGFDALHPKPRSDRGRPRRTPPAVAALLTELKERHPEGSVHTVMRQAQASGQLPAGRTWPQPPSTACSSTPA